MADRRHIDEAGAEWASRYESEVYRQLQLLGVDCRRCSADEGDTFSYSSSVVRGRCLECQSSEVVQDRTYTPDLFISSLPGYEEHGGCYVEIKGYWPAPKRGLLRSVYKGQPEAPLVFIFQKDYWVTRGKSKYTDYVAKFTPGWGCMIWDNTPRLAPGEKRGGKKIVPMLDLAPIVAYIKGRESSQ